MKYLFVDTNILIDYSKGHDKILSNLLQLQEQKEVVLHINPIVIAEFMTDLSLKNTALAEKAEKFFSFFTTVAINGRIGVLAGKLLRENRSDYLGDAIIAATCIEAKCALVTRNQKHFIKIPNLKHYEVS